MPSDTRWLYIIVLAFALGVLTRSCFPFGWSEIVFIAGLGLLVSWYARPILWGVILFVFALGLARLEIASLGEADPYLESKLGQEIVFEGLIKREPDERSTTMHLYVETKYGLVLVVTRNDREWKYGDYVRVTGEIEHPESFATDLGRQFNYRGYLLAKGVAYTTSFAEVELIRAGEGDLLFATIFRAKSAFMDRIERLIPEPEAGLSLGLLLGVKRALGEELETDFRRAGIIHIVVLSGYNMAIVSGFILFVLGALFGVRTSSLVGIVGIVLFAVMVGLSATVVRAAIMGVLVLLLGLSGRTYLVLRGLFVAGGLMILSNPYSLAFDVGFQLSFLATLGLIICSPYLEERLSVMPTTIGLRGFLTATLATQLFVLPILLYQIGEFSVVAVLVNVLVLPMVPLAMLLAFLTGVTSFISMSLASGLAFITYLSLAYIINVAEYFANLPLAAFSVPPFPFILVPLGYALIGLVIWYLRQRWFLNPA